MTVRRSIGRGIGPNQSRVLKGAFAGFERYGRAAAGTAGVAQAPPPDPAFGAWALPCHNSRLALTRHVTRPAASPCFHAAPGRLRPTQWKPVQEPTNSH
ncbi:hypothetical protein CBM2609_B10056 [Cupriavidus taiwanensis]|nr:hypothetical protein CBM2604_B10055 [Cupriavidus taiwanensis]SOZ29726.1 hypothetical protein CBM2609_B10056 [Cupriavidus taiwanensis]SOZ46901.1 hypothetical protein CBM2610_B10054 [Cupriavidus taiwanensis]